jgi:hypothetical protein
MKREEYKNAPTIKIQGSCNDSIKRVIWNVVLVKDKYIDIIKINNYDYINNIELIHALREELDLNFEIDNDLKDGNILFVKEDKLIAEIVY